MKVESGNTESWQVYNNFLQTGDRTVVIGPSTAPWDKPALLYVCTLLKDGGEVIVVDPQWGPNHYSPDELEKKFGRVDGIPDFTGYHLECIRKAKQMSLPLIVPQWLGPGSAAQHIELSDHSVDAIIDHTVSPFVSVYSQLEEKWKDNLGQIYREYHRVLKPDGKLILQTNTYESEAYSKMLQSGLLAEVLESSGIRIIYKTYVDDVFRIPIAPQVYQEWQQKFGEYSEAHQTEYFFFSRVQELNGRYMLVFDKVWSNGPDMLVGINTV